jgi:hypothetical protein
MEVHFTPELEAKLTHSAAQQGRHPDELVQDVLTRYFEEEAASGAALVDVMQASPYKDIDLQPRRDRLPVRDAVL